MFSTGFNLNAREYINFFECKRTGFYEFIQLTIVKNFYIYAFLNFSLWIMQVQHHQSYF